jgi:hypothetical protein
VFSCSASSLCFSARNKGIANGYPFVSVETVNHSELFQIRKAGFESFAQAGIKALYQQTRKAEFRISAKALDQPISASVITSFPSSTR